MECEFESEVLAAAIQSRWPDRVGAELRAHVKSCDTCADLAVVASAVSGSREATRRDISIPDSGRVWWVAQMRARRENVRAAGRPITAVQVLSFACAMGLLGACFGASSDWFRSTLLQFEKLAPVAATMITEHSLLAVIAAALILLVPGAVYLIVVRD
jgi:hypothetical protein